LSFPLETATFAFLAITDVGFVYEFKLINDMTIGIKRISSLLVFMFVSVVMMAQNVQFHYDLGHVLYDDLDSRPAVTTTVEMFKPDKWGNTFFFIDFDYKNDGAVGAYWEISRELNISKNRQWAMHVEYDGGLNIGGSFQHAALVGPAWNWASADFSRTFSLQLLYKYYFYSKSSHARPFSSVQLTEVWGINFHRNMFTFSGYADLWYDRNVKGKWAFCAEPQIWFNFNTLKGWNDINLSVGSETEVSYNFVWNDSGHNNRFYAIPTLAFKWTF